MAKKQIVLVDPPKIEIDLSDIKKINKAIDELGDVRSLLDDIKDCSDDLKTVGFLAGQAYAIADRLETDLINTMLRIESEDDDNDTN